MPHRLASFTASYFVACFDDHHVMAITLFAWEATESERQLARLIVASVHVQPAGPPVALQGPWEIMARCGAAGSRQHR